MVREDKDEINLLDLWLIVWSRRRMISWVIAVMTSGTLFISLIVPDTYQAKAIITPVTQKEGAGFGLGSMLAQQFGSIPGISLPAPSSANEIVNLLNSRILGEKIITQYNLLPFLFHERWDTDKKTWKESKVILNPIRWILGLFRWILPDTPAAIQKKDSSVPDIWDGLRELENMVSVKLSIKENSITITAETWDPEFSAKLIDYYLVTLTDYMSAEARRVALTNRKYLESQLGDTTDPLIKQKIYNMIAQQIETSTMAEVKENYAFKVIDPPKVPDKKIKPKRGQLVVLAFVMSIFIGVCAAFVTEYISKLKAPSERRFNIVDDL